MLSNSKITVLSEGENGVSKHSVSMLAFRVLTKSEQ